MEKKYMVCVESVHCPSLTVGETYLCKLNIRKAPDEIIRVWDGSNNYLGMYKQNRFVLPENFEERLENYHDVARCESRKIQQLLNDLEKVEAKRSKIIRKIKQNYNKLGKQLELL